MLNFLSSVLVTDVLCIASGRRVRTRLNFPISL